MTDKEKAYVDKVHREAVMAENPETVWFPADAVLKLTTIIRSYEKMLAEAPVVYGFPGIWQNKPDMAGDTHTARLVDIAPIAPKKDQLITIHEEEVA